MAWPPLRRVRWSRTWRLIPGRYPPIQLFERIADPADWEALADVEALTNPRIRDEIGEISLLPPEERIAGPGASWVMGSFVHIGRPSRFSDGSYGVYYAARHRDTAVAETCHHLALFYGATAEAALDLEMRVLVGPVDATFHDLRGDAGQATSLLDPTSYTASQTFGQALRAAGSNGVAFPSVRHAAGQCLGAFRPRAVHPPEEAGFLRYHWDGERFDRYFDYAADRWAAPPG